MQINAEEAAKVIEAGQRKAFEMGIPVIIAVLDAAANLKAFNRMDGAVLGSIDIALKKAKTSAMFECNSEVVWEYCKPGAPAPALELTNGGLAPFAGGIPLRAASGELIGAVGISGGSVAQDFAIAEAAAAALPAASRDRAEDRSETVNEY
jgi:uncharacterized protein GlcG (DUF336 family)